MTRKPSVSAKYVLCQFYLNHIDDIDTMKETATIDFYVALSWKDPGLIGRLYDDFDKEMVFKPDIELLGAKKVTKTGGESSWVNLNVSAYGLVTATQRYKGVVNMPQDLHHFPFDVQTLKIALKSASWGQDDMVLINATKPESLREQTKEIEVTEWDVVSGLEAKEGSYLSRFNLFTFSTLEISVRLRRKVTFYMTKIVAIIVMLVVMGLTVFAIDPLSLVDRVNIVFTLFLATVAFQFVLGASIPMVAYTTALDKFVFAAYAHLFYLAVETVSLNLSVSTSDQGAAVDKVAGIVYICTFGTVLLLFCSFGIYWSWQIDREAQAGSKAAEEEEQKAEKEKKEKQQEEKKGVETKE